MLMESLYAVKMGMRRILGISLLLKMVRNADVEIMGI